MSEFNGAFNNAIIHYGRGATWEIGKPYCDGKGLSYWYNKIIYNRYQVHKITNIDWPKLKQWAEEQ